MGRAAASTSSIARQAPRPGGGLAFKDETLEGRIQLDDRTFEGCRFEHAVLVYSGGRPPHIQGCEFRDVTFEFQGAAARSLAFLQAMSTPASGLRSIFKASFPTLFAH